MLILILFNIQNLQSVAFSFEKGSSGQNHFLSASHQPIEKFHTQISHPSYSLMPFGKPWKKDQLC